MTRHRGSHRHCGSHWHCGLSGTAGRTGTTDPTGTAGSPEPPAPWAHQSHQHRGSHRHGRICPGATCPSSLWHHLPTHTCTSSRSNCHTTPQPIVPLRSSPACSRAKFFKLERNESVEIHRAEPDVARSPGAAGGTNVTTPPCQNGGYCRSLFTTTSLYRTLRCQTRDEENELLNSCSALFLLFFRSSTPIIQSCLLLFFIQQGHGDFS